MHIAFRRKQRLSISMILLALVPSFVGCESHSSGVTQTETKTQIERLFNLYKAYSDTNRKAPPNEKALKEFGKGLSEKQLDELLIGKDLESIFVSTRDKQPFEIVYGVPLSSANEPVAVIYEKVGLDGMKYAALTIGYTEEYDEETLQSYIPKKR